MLWGKEKEDIFKLVSVNFVDYDNEMQTDSNGDPPKSPELQKTFKFMEVNEAIDIGLPPKRTKLLVREEYVLLTDAIEAYRSSGKGGMMITGHSGIGAYSFKSIIARSVSNLSLLRLLRSRQINLFDIHSGCQTSAERTHFLSDEAGTRIYLFCENGVYLIPVHIGPMRPSEFVDDCAELGITLNSVNGPIYLIDSTVSLDKPPALFCERYLPIFVVQAACESPAANRGRWMRGKGAFRYIMNPWTWSEIVAGYAAPMFFQLVNALILKSRGQAHFADYTCEGNFFPSRGLRDARTVSTRVLRHP